MEIDSNLSKKCRICGDKALSFNFNGLSCESCKSFFRRNSLKKKGGKCEINKLTRKCCSRCRLEKCLEIGMKKEQVMKYEKMNQNRLESPGNLHDNVQAEENLRYKPAENSKLFDFGIWERIKFDELKRAALVFEQHSYCTLQLSDGASLMHVFQQQKIYIKKIIEFCQSLEAFRCLKTSDQLILLKDFFIECLTVKCAHHYEVDQNGFPNEFTESALFAQIAMIFPYAEQKKREIYLKYIRSLHHEIQYDKNIRDLLIAISMFLQKDGITCLEYIRYHYFVYCRLLLRYLERKYGDKHKAARKYSNLMHFMDRMCHIREMIYNTCMDIDAGLLSQVLSKIYHHNHKQIPV